MEQTIEEHLGSWSKCVAKIAKCVAKFEMCCEDFEMCYKDFEMCFEYFRICSEFKMCFEEFGKSCAKFLEVPPIVLTYLKKNTSEQHTANRSCQLALFSPTGCV